MPAKRFTAMLPSRSPQQPQLRRANLPAHRRPRGTIFLLADERRPTSFDLGSANPLTQLVNAKVKCAVHRRNCDLSQLGGIQQQTVRNLCMALIRPASFTCGVRKLRYKNIYFAQCSAKARSPATEMLCRLHPARSDAAIYITFIAAVRLCSRILTMLDAISARSFARHAAGWGSLGAQPYAATVICHSRPQDAGTGIVRIPQSRLRLW
jgi:hypothetical protein